MQEMSEINDKMDMDNDIIHTSKEYKTIYFKLTFLSGLKKIYLKGDKAIKVIPYASSKLPSTDITNIVHENLVRHYSIEKNNTNLHITMEYCQDGNLQQNLQKLKLFGGKQLPLKTLLQYMQQLAAALLKLHSHEIILGNMHPSHILLCRDKSVMKIANFGMPKPSEMCCKYCKPHCEKYMCVLDTKYVAPEVLAHQKFTKEADIWSLGCIFYELMFQEYKGVFFYDCMMKKTTFYNRMRRAITTVYIPDIADLMVQLFHLDPSQRPKAQTVYYKISKFIADKLYDKYITCKVTYINTPSWIPAKNSHTGCYCNGVMYMFGGWTNTNTNELHAYDTRTKVFTKIVPRGKKPMGRSGASLAAHEDSLWLFGGWGMCISYMLRMTFLGGYYNLQDTYQFHIPTHTWYEIKCSGDIPVPRSYHSAVCNKGYMYVFAGKCAGYYVNDVKRLDLKEHVWVDLKTYGGVPRPRNLIWACCVNDTLYVYGGDDGKKIYFDDFWALDLKTHYWKQIICSEPPPEKLAGRNGYTLCGYKNYVIIYGGFRNPGKRTYFNDSYVYDILKNKWYIGKYVGLHLPQPTYSHCAGMSEDGKMYVWAGAAPRDSTNELHVLEFDFMVQTEPYPNLRKPAFYDIELSFWE